MKSILTCSHCDGVFGWRVYATHVKTCIEATKATWSESDYSKTYYRQVRAMSRFKQVGDPRRRNQFKSWGWWMVRPDGPVLVQAEVS